MIWISSTQMTRTYDRSNPHIAHPCASFLRHPAPVLLEEGPYATRGAFGILIAIVALMVLQEPTNKEISRFYADNAYPLAKGKNVVNVILVDFRGSDTMVEITVLTIAAIGVYSMLKLKTNPSEKE